MLTQNLLYWFFKPVGVAVKATQIGQAMMEVTARGSEFSNGDILSTRKIVRYSDTLKKRQALKNEWLDRQPKPKANKSLNTEAGDAGSG